MKENNDFYVTSVVVSIPLLKLTFFSSSPTIVLLLCGTYNITHDHKIQ